MYTKKLYAGWADMDFNSHFRSDGKLAARVSSTGGRLDLAERKLIAPPPPLLAAMNSLEKTSDFLVLPSSVRTATARTPW